MIYLHQSTKKLHHGLSSIVSPLRLSLGEVSSPLQLDITHPILEAECVNVDPPTPSQSSASHSLHRLPRHLHRKQHSLRRLNLHHLRFDMITSTHLHAKLRRPVLDVPLQPPRSDDRWSGNRDNPHVLGQESRSQRRAYQILPLAQEEHNTLAREEIDVPTREGGV